MNLNFNRKLFAVGATFFLAARVFPADTNAVPAVLPSVTPGITREEVADNYLHIQEQIHATQLAIEQNQEAAMESAQSNANTLAARLQSLEQSVAKQRPGDADGARKTEPLVLMMAGGFGVGRA